MHRRLNVFFLTIATSWGLLTGWAHAEDAASPAPAEAAEPLAAEEAAPSTDNASGFLGVAVAESPASGSTDAAPPRGHRPPEVALVVTHVQPGSPAAAAGLRSGDTLRQIDDQRLLHPVQFRRLVASYGPGDEVALGVVRRGEPLELSATLAARPGASDDRFAAPLGFPQRLEPFAPGLDPFDLPRMQLDLDRMNLDLERMQLEMDERVKQMQEQLRGLNPQDGLNLELLEDMQRFRLDAPAIRGRGQSVAVVDDGEHRLTVKTDADGRHLHVVDADGAVLFDGPIDTPEQLDAVPDELRGKLPAAEPDNPWGPVRPATGADTGQAV